MYMCSLGAGAAPLLEAPKRVAIYKVGGAAVGRVLGVGEGPGEVAVRVEELPHLARVVDARAAALPEPQRIVERVRDGTCANDVVDGVVAAGHRCVDGVAAAASIRGRGVPDP